MKNKQLWVRRYLWTSGIVFMLLMAASLLRGREMDRALSESFTWALVSAAVFTGWRYRQVRKGATCALCKETADSLPLFLTSWPDRRSSRGDAHLQGAQIGQRVQRDIWGEFDDDRLLRSDRCRAKQRAQNDDDLAESHCVSPVIRWGRGVATVTPRVARTAELE